MKFINGVFSIYKRMTDKYHPIIDKCSKDNIFAIAGQSAFYILLSAVPLTMFIVSLLQNLHIPVNVIENALDSIFSTEMVKQISSFLNDAYSNSVGISLITLIVTLWSASQGIHAITNGLNRIYDSYENRNWLYVRIRAMIYTIILFVIILICLSVIVLGKSLNSLLSPIMKYVPDIVSLVYQLRFALFFVFLVIIFALVFRNIPNISKAEHRQYKFRNQLPGAILCAISWFVLSLGISIYVDDFHGFSVYGSLTRLAVIMIWIYFCMLALMICAEINFVYNDKINNIHIKSMIINIKKKLRGKK